jgi:hypothetical protein
MRLKKPSFKRLNCAFKVCLHYVKIQSGRSVQHYNDRPCRALLVTILPELETFISRKNKTSHVM